MSELIENRYPRRQEDISEIDRLRAENERLRAGLEKVVAWYNCAVYPDALDEMYIEVQKALKSTNEKGKA